MIGVGAPGLMFWLRVTPTAVLRTVAAPKATGPQGGLSDPPRVRRGDRGREWLAEIRSAECWRPPVPGNDRPGGPEVVALTYRSEGSLAPNQSVTKASRGCFHSWGGSLCHQSAESSSDFSQL